MRRTRYEHGLVVRRRAQASESRREARWARRGLRRIRQTRTGDKVLELKRAMRSRAPAYKKPAKEALGEDVAVKALTMEESGRGLKGHAMSRTPSSVSAR